MKDKLPQYDEDFQLDMVNMSYGVAICLGALVYLVFYTPKRKVKIMLLGRKRTSDDLSLNRWLF